MTVASIFVGALLAAAVEGSQNMGCGDGVGLCGVLTLESGAGSGYYHHDGVSVHGLWPEVWVSAPWVLRHVG